MAEGGKKIRLTEGSTRSLKVTTDATKKFVKKQPPAQDSKKK